MRQLPQSVRLLDLVLRQELIARIDYETDAIIQQSLRHELMNDVTVITVAHRLQTIMDYDKIVGRSWICMRDLSSFWSFSDEFFRWDDKTKS